MLEAHSKKLWKQTIYTDKLLKDVVKETLKLVAQLSRNELSEKKCLKERRQNQLKETQDDTIQRFQTVLENVRRELNTIQRSSTPSLNKESEISKILSKVIVDEQGGSNTEILKPSRRLRNL